ncbi:MAG: hypothetical protein Unbinned338contig1000_48 [Prokaryotic dsDNA virus sp.]|nr:MAG: hypothetical protein Unbinned338contig1000_48 [Prokaryotic dsDNA virus sp.]|tara:strand:+ start:28738 stop:29136 length:399 start_codon:yes stop_codon:yes gene_type:complete
MKTKNIRNALKAVIEVANILPAAHENGTTQARPYIDVKIASARRENNLLAGGAFLREIGALDVTVCVDEGTYANAASDYADDIAALFPKGLRIDAPGGVVVITDVPDVRAGFNADAEYRVPVMVRYEAAPLG